MALIRSILCVKQILRNYKKWNNIC